MTPYRPNMTPDPRLTRRIFDQTGTYASHEQEIIEGLESTVEEEVGRLTERVETLVNQVGQFSAQVLERPAKWITQIRDLGDERYILTEPIMILIEERLDCDSVIASFPEVGVFGEGTTDTEAILRLKEAILDLYDELIEIDPQELGKLPQMWLRVLRRIITEWQPSNEME